MDNKRQFNVRLPDHSWEQLEEAQRRTGMTQVQVLILALDRLLPQIRQEHPDRALEYEEITP